MLTYDLVTLNISVLITQMTLKSQVNNLFKFTHWIKFHGIAREGYFGTKILNSKHSFILTHNFYEHFEAPS